MKAEISHRSLMKTSALGSLALASSAFTLPFSQMVRAAEAPVEEKTVWLVRKQFTSRIRPVIMIRTMITNVRLRTARKTCVNRMML